MSQPQTVIPQTPLRDSGQDAEQAAAQQMERWYEAWNAHDADAIAACLTEDALLEEASGTYRGPDPVREWARSVFRASADSRLEMLEGWVTAGGSVMATYWKFTFTFTGLYDPLGLAPNNQRIELLGMDRNEFRDRKIARHQIFYDGADLARQMGAAPESVPLGGH